MEKERVVTRDDLNRELRKYLVLNPNGVIVLNAARSVSYSKVIELLDSLRQVGGDRVALATLPGESQKPMILNPDFETPSNTPINPIPDASLNNELVTGFSVTNPSNNLQLGTENPPPVVPLPPTDAVPETPTNNN